MTDTPEPAGSDVPAGIVARFIAALGGPGSTHAPTDPDRWCEIVAALLATDGAALSLSVDEDLVPPLGTDTPAAAVGEMLQFTVREGPCISAYTDEVAAFVLDAHDPDDPGWSRWPDYVAGLVAHTTFRGAFAYPLLVHGLAVGSLNLYRHAPGGPPALADATDLARHIGDHLLPDALHDPGSGATGRERSAWMHSPPARHRRQVWLAQGMVLRANEVTAGQALEMLRARAWSEDRLLDDLAADIVAGSVAPPLLGSDD